MCIDIDNILRQTEFINFGSNIPCDISIDDIEGEYLSVEFFPENQSKESFENAEFNNIFSYDDIVNNRVQGYKFPNKVISLEETCEILNNIFDIVKDNTDKCTQCGTYIVEDVRQNEDEEIICEECLINNIAKRLDII